MCDKATGDSDQVNKVENSTVCIVTVLAGVVTRLDGLEAHGINQAAPDLHRLVFQGFDGDHIVKKAASVVPHHRAHPERQVAVFVSNGAPLNEVEDLNREASNEVITTSAQVRVNSQASC